MRVIIIEDKDARELLDRLELAKLRATNYRGNPVTFEEMHQTFHFHVVRWLQDQGANIVR